MDMITLAMAKNYTDRQRNGYTETNKVVLDEENPNAAYTGELVGLRVLDYAPMRRRLLTEMKRPEGDVTILYKKEMIAGQFMFEITYTSNNGVLNKPALIISGLNLQLYCPLFFGGFDDYQFLMYIYDETSDTLGMGITLQKGWYMLNASTFATQAVDLEINPCLFFLDAADVINFDLDNFSEDAIFEIEVKQENIIGVSSYQHIVPIDAAMFTSEAIASIWSAVNYDEENKTLLMESIVTFNEGRKTTIKWDTIHPIDPKFLPGVCLPVVELSTLNGECTAEENALLTSAYETRLPIILRINDENNTVSNVCNLGFHEDLVPFYSTQVVVSDTTTTLYLHYADGIWVVEVV